MSIVVKRGNTGRPQHYTTDTDAVDGLVTKLQDLDASSILAGAVPDDITPLGPGPFVIESGGWNNVKNIFFDGHLGNGTLTLKDYVHVDVDITDGGGNSTVNILNSKRGNIALGDGNDTLNISLVTNDSGWSNTFLINAGDGNDEVLIQAGEAQTGPEDATQATITDGSFTTVRADLGDGNDSYENLTKSRDIVEGGDGNDEILTGDGDDEVRGGDGNDEIDAGGGNDEISGGDGNDDLVGGEGNDEIHGGDGNDDFFAGEGNDTLRGDDGNDTFFFGGSDGSNTIRDFEIGDDLIDLQAIGGVMFGDLTIAPGPVLGTLITIAGFSTEILLENIDDPATIDAGDFIF